MREKDDKDENDKNTVFASTIRYGRAVANRGFKKSVCVFKEYDYCLQ